MSKVTATEARQHVQEGGLFRLVAEPGISLADGAAIAGLRVQIGTENAATGKVRWKDGPWLIGTDQASYLSALEAARLVFDGTATLPGDRAEGSAA